MQIPIFTAGASVDLTLSAPSGYLASDGWLLKLRLAARLVGGTVVTLDTTASGSDYRLQVSAATTADWGVGDYAYAAWVQKAAELVMVGEGSTVVRPNPTLLPAGYDGRSQARKALDDAKAALATYTATNGAVRRYKVGEREREFNSTGEIIRLITFWEQQVLQEDRLAGRAEMPARRIYSRI